MDYVTFLNRVIDDGIAAARADYVRPDQATKLTGSIEGFEACRDKRPDELTALFVAANREAEEHRDGPIDEYWRYRCRALEVEWTGDNVLDSSRRFRSPFWAHALATLSVR